MYSNSDLGRYRQADMLRHAESVRRSREAAGARAAERRSAVRRVAGAVVSTLLWPVKH